MSNGLEKWALIIPSESEVTQAFAWVNSNFTSYKQVGFNSWTSIAPIYDPVDWLDVRFFINEQSLRGARIHGFIDLRSEIHIAHDEVKEITLLQIAKSRLFGRQSFYPHPYPGEQIHEFDLRRSGEQADAFPDPRGYDLYGIPDEPVSLASEEWLRRGSRQGLWARRIAAERDLGRRSLDDVPTVGGIQRRSKGGSSLPGGVPERRALQNRPRVPFRMGQAKPASEAPDAEERNDRSRARLGHTSKLPDWLDPKRS